MGKQSETWGAEWLAGFLWVTRLEDGAERMVKLKSAETGRCITRGQFKSSCESHGFDRACEVFFKLGIDA